MEPTYQITNIKAENAEGTQYGAEIGGKVWSGITEKSRFWEAVQEAIDEGAEVAPYVAPPEPNEDLIELQAIDKDMARITEDLIDALKDKGVIADEDLPVTVVEKINRRKLLRSRL